MAYYYNSAYSGSEYGEYNFNSYAANYDYAQVPSFMTYPNHEYNQVQPYYGYDQSLYFSPNYNYSDSTFSDPKSKSSYFSPNYNYSATTFSDPKSIVYDPNYGMSHLVISYSNLEFNEPAFDDYDPTPYGGGYDISETYGKPLPPSDKICYPRSGSSSIPAGSIVPIPNVEEEIHEKEKAIKPQNETALATAGQVFDEMPQSQDSSKNQPREIEDNNFDASDLKPHEEIEDDYSAGSDYGSGIGNGYDGGECDENEKQVVTQYPSGYGLETVDLCESLFGYWPCLSKMKKRECCCEEVSDRGNCWQENMWKGSADYLFGNPYPYGGRGEDGSSYGGGGGGGDIVYGYERHYPIESQYRQIDYSDQSW